MIQRRKVIIGAMGVAAAATAATAAGCSSSSGKKGSGDTAWIDPASADAKPTAAPVEVTVTPGTGAANISPADPIVVAATGGTVQSVKVTAGKAEVAGEVQSDGTWRSTEDLAYGKTYKVVTTTTDSLGATAEHTSTFATVKPANVAKITFQANGLNALKTGGTYGAGQPVIVAFSKAVNKKAAEQAIEITTSPSVAGKFFWKDDRTVHWRPAKYWAAGTQVKVSVKAFGVKLGKTVYGARNASASFKVDRQLIAISDNRTHMTKVYINGKLVRTMKSSLGKGGGTTGANGEYINYWTAGGPHLVLEKKRRHTMSSASYGVSDPNDPNYYVSENIEYCTRISYSGEFLHAAPWNGSLGRANLSHGCINLSTSDAKWVYDNFILGDIVDVTNSPRKLPIWNGLGDWTVPFDRYGK
ncbi:hypothetical protein Ait01nite_092480 [Actinoplanes italicus]|uniref:Lipoprotein-anchoring transpeptidase ErfK/SrfK n=1 Tax=Actinoplanes italicus TaxID=113567 RepID=A0A2T0K2M9_9ACTN|nr:Ig-like domain-containing protein [Actinoplanes italicus]PRX17072.1 lipoprotein-anchoring transpeptidase ErfK/SrfK [Actinoplanes italicus]GIE36203.1 hypothetical protein Ait01nite_092480 [Actinoplanes italicus]